jgi:L-2-hydroxyglutarate oxidase LhgO
MNNIEELDIAIIGAGILGLSVAKSLLTEHPDLRIFLFEKEDNLGAHSSGRNSGVLHAGFYYSHDSLKAKFCSEGNFELRDFCLRKDITIKELGKVVVTTNEIEEERHHLLSEPRSPSHQWPRQNGAVAQEALCHAQPHVTPCHRLLRPAAAPGL